MPSQSLDTSCCFISRLGMFFEHSTAHHTENQKMLNKTPQRSALHVFSFLPHSLHDTADPRIKHVLPSPKHCANALKLREAISRLNCPSGRIHGLGNSWKRSLTSFGRSRLPSRAFLPLEKAVSTNPSAGDLDSRSLAELQRSQKEKRPVPLIICLRLRAWSSG